MQPVKRDSILLIAAEPVIARFHYEGRTFPGRAKSNHYRQLVDTAQERFAFHGKRAEGRQFFRRASLGDFPVALEDVPRYFGPDSPDEDTADFQQRNGQGAPDEKAPFANGANLFRQHAIGLLSPRGKREIRAWFGEDNVQGQPVVGLSAAFANVSHGFCCRQTVELSKLDCPALADDATLCCVEPPPEFRDSTWQEWTVDATHSRVWNAQGKAEPAKVRSGQVVGRPFRLEGCCRQMR
jgi:hypothetical protein